MSVVAVAGGTGKLGRTIVEAIVARGTHKVVVLARQSSEAKAQELGVPVLGADYSSVEAVRDVLQANDVGTVISTLDATTAPQAELALIAAAEQSRTTTRFIPSAWGIRYTAEAAAIFPPGAAKIAARKALDASTLQHTTVINGMFVDYYTVPGIPSRMGSFPLAVDMAHNAAAIPGSGSVPVAFTHTTDVAAFVAHLLSQPEWPADSYVVGERLTWREFVEVAEEVKGSKFEVSFDALETLQKGQATELPGYKELYPFFPKEMLVPFVAAFGVWYEKGFFDFEVPAGQVGFKARSVRELLKEAWQ